MGNGGDPSPGARERGWPLSRLGSAGEFAGAGTGREGGPEGLAEYLETKSIFVAPAPVA